MSTYRQLTYLILDEAKGISDDFTYTEDHLIFLLDKYRASILKQKYADIKKQIPESNYQTICLDLKQVPAISGEPCEGGAYLRSENKVPFMMELGIPKVTSLDYFQGDFNFVSRERLRFVGHNKFLKNVIYTAVAPDQYLYFKSSNPQFLYLKKIKVTGIFENASEATKLACDHENSCEILDAVFPLEEAFNPLITEMILKELLGATYRPEDSKNNAADDLAALQTNKG